MTSPAGRLRLIPSGAAATGRGADGDIYASSSFGPADTTFGLDRTHLTDEGYDARGLYNGARAKELDYRSSFYRCRHHDAKAFDMNGTMLAPDERGRQFPGALPFIASSGASRFVPLAQRRPHAPYRVARTIVKAFTGMLFGHNRWPQIRSTDQDTQAFGEAISKAANLRNRMVRARNIGGSCGTAGLSWFFKAGKPKVRVHSGRFVHVLEWDDVDDLVPAHVTELYQTTAKRRLEDGKVEECRAWVRRDWTKHADVVFKPVEDRGENPKLWEVDRERSIDHGDGECHFVWMPNFPDDENPSTTDGEPDYAELYEQMSTLDMTNSVHVRGTTLNLDPTLKLRMDPESVKGALVQKGSDNAIVTGEAGDADYMTLSSDVVAGGEKIVGGQRKQILEVAQCVVPDPGELSGAESSLTVRLRYAPMIGAADLLREPCGVAIVRLLDQMKRSAQRRMGAARGEQPELVEYEVPVEPENDAVPEPEAAPAGEVEPGAEDVLKNEDLEPEEQEPLAVEYYLALPPRPVEEPVIGPDGKPTGEVRIEMKEIHPGNGEFELEWGDYFPPTPDDRQKGVAAASTAAGGRPVLSQRTAVELAANLVNRDGLKEWERVVDEAQRSRALEVDLTPGTGGEVSQENELPPGAEPIVPPEQTSAGASAPQEVDQPTSKEGILGVADISVVVTVNEARASLGLDPLKTEHGQLDPDGQLTVAEFRAKREAKGEGEGEQQAPRPPKLPIPPGAPAAPQTLPIEAPGGTAGGS